MFDNIPCIQLCVVGDRVKTNSYLARCVVIWNMSSIHLRTQVMTYEGNKNHYDWPQIPSGFSPQDLSQWSLVTALSLHHRITAPPTRGRWPAYCPPHVAIVGCNAICDDQRSLSLSLSLSRLHSVIRASGSSCHWHCVHSLAGLAWAGLSGLSAESPLRSVSLSHSLPRSKIWLYCNCNFS